MENFRMFLIKHRRMWVFCSWIFVFIPSILFFFLRLPLLGLILMLILLECLILPTSAWMKLIKSKVALLNEMCDPYPYLEFTESLMPYRLTPETHMEIEIDHAAMLDNIGYSREALEALLSINIDRSPGIIQFTKIAYYTALAIMFYQSGELVRGDMSRSKAMQIYNDVSESKMKTLYAAVIESVDIEYLIAYKQYEEALSKLGSQEIKSKFSAVTNAWRTAQVFIATDRPSEAIEPLRFVSENGGRLDIRREANELLAKIK